MSVIGILRQTLEELTPFDERFHPPNPKRLPNPIDVPNRTNMRVAELNGTGTKPSAHASENRHWKNMYDAKNRNIATPYVITP